MILYTCTHTQLENYCFLPLKWKKSYLIIKADHYHSQLLSNSDVFIFDVFWVSWFSRTNLQHSIYLSRKQTTQRLQMIMKVMFSTIFYIGDRSSATTLASQLATSQWPWAESCLWVWLQKVMTELGFHALSIRLTEKQQNSLCFTTFLIHLVQYLI